MKPMMTIGRPRTKDRPTPPASPKEAAAPATPSAPPQDAADGKTDDAKKPDKKEEKKSGGNNQALGSALIVAVIMILFLIWQSAGGFKKAKNEATGNNETSTITFGPKELVDTNLFTEKGDRIRYEAPTAPFMIEADDRPQPIVKDTTKIAGDFGMIRVKGLDKKGTVKITVTHKPKQ